MKRRSFIQAASTISLPVMLNGFGISTIAKSSIFDNIDAEDDRVLVLIQCNGGYDGLAMLHPLAQYSKLSSLRSNIIIPESQTLKIQDDIGLHPSMQGFSNLFSDHKINFIQSVGYPDQNRSHFRSKDIWTSGSAADAYESTGWLGRYLDTQYPDFPDNYPNEQNPDPFAITIGNSVSSTCQGVASNFSMAINDPFNLVPLTISEGGTLPDNFYGDQIAFLRDAILKSNQYADIITEAANKGTNTLDYPDSSLARQLRTVALLISGGLKSKIYVVNIGGFDLHANQVDNGDVTGGNMGELLAQLSGAMSTFQNDLMNLGVEERVISMTFTEFGRRIRSNGSLGTDHGSAAPLILQGPCVNYGITGSNNVLPDIIDNQTGLPMQFDFRSVYGSVLMDWFNVSEVDVRTLLFEDFQYLPIIKSCSSIPTANDKIDESKFGIKVFPNPLSDRVQVQFTLQETQNVVIKMVDGLGKTVQVIHNRSLHPGQHNIDIDMGKYATGQYYINVMTDSGRISRSVLKSN